MNWTTDKACFNISLRNACLTIAIFFLCTIVLNVIARPSYLNHSTSLVGMVLELVGNLALLFGTLWSNPWLVLVWLIQAVLFFIGWPVAFFGVIFNYGDYRAMAYFHNVFLIIVEYLIVLALFAYCTYLVYSFFVQLRNNQSNPQHSVVV